MWCICEDMGHRYNIFWFGRYLPFFFVAEIEFGAQTNRLKKFHFQFSQKVCAERNIHSIIGTLNFIAVQYRWRFVNVRRQKSDSKIIEHIVGNNLIILFSIFIIFAFEIQFNSIQRYQMRMIHQILVSIIYMGEILIIRPCPCCHTILILSTLFTTLQQFNWPRPDETLSKYFLHQKPNEKLYKGN